MKDYRFSEAKEICQKRKVNKLPCEECEFYKLCTWQGFSSMEIEPRDMIDLPSINKYKLCESDEDTRYQVIYRLPSICKIDIDYMGVSQEAARQDLESIKKWDNEENA